MQIFYFDGLPIKVYFDNNIGRWVATDFKNIYCQLYPYYKEELVFLNLKEILKKHGASYSKEGEFFILSNNNENSIELAEKLYLFIIELLKNNKHFYTIIGF